MIWAYDTYRREVVLFCETMKEQLCRITYNFYLDQLTSPEKREEIRKLIAHNLGGPIPPLPPNYRIRELPKFNSKGGNLFGPIKLDNCPNSGEAGKI